jgi:hypothetical protein
MAASTPETGCQILHVPLSPCPLVGTTSRTQVRAFGDDNLLRRRNLGHEDYVRFWSGRHFFHPDLSAVKDFFGAGRPVTGGDSHVRAAPF